MNELFRIRRNQTLLWLVITVGLWLIHQQLFGATMVLALLIAAAMVAVANAALLLILRGEQVSMSECLTTLGGLLASLYGRDK